MCDATRTEQKLKDIYDSWFHCKPSRDTVTPCPFCNKQMHCKYIVMHLALYKCHGVAKHCRAVLLGLSAHIRAQQSIYNITAGWLPFEGEVKHIKAIIPY